MIERDVENHLIREVRKIGGDCRKVQWVGRRGAPDRLVMYKGAHFVELKRPGGKPRRNQLKEIHKLNRHGITAICLTTIAEVDNFIEGLKNGAF